jgi:hypothetical protein
MRRGMRCLIPRMLFYVLALNFEVAEGARRRQRGPDLFNFVDIPRVLHECQRCQVGAN